MTVGNAIFQGIVQGLTEFLPISSSGHLALIQYFTGQGESGGLLFTVLLHMGTLLAVLLAFWKTIAELVTEFFRMLADIFRGRFSIKEANGKRRMIFLLIIGTLPLLLTVFLKDWFESLSQNLLAIGLCFFATSVLLFLSDRCVKGHKTAKSMKYRDAVAVGIMQAVAPLPGLSRSGSTISVGLLAGLDRKYAVTYSFILGVPAVIGANILELGEAAKEGLNIPVPALAAGIICSLIFGLLAIRLVRWLVTSDKFVYFAWYTLVLGVVTIAVHFIETLTNGMLKTIVAG